MVMWVKTPNVSSKASIRNRTEENSIALTAYWNSTNRSDMGYYRCEADNGIGEIVSSDWVHLNVQCKLLFN